jgi:hypothetical protein
VRARRADAGLGHLAAAARTAPFTIALGSAFYAGSPADGVFFHVHDVDGGISLFRATAVPPGRVIDFPPHVTIVHPRTSDRGRQAWDELAGTAFRRGHWQTLRSLPLTGKASAGRGGLVVQAAVVDAQGQHRQVDQRGGGARRPGPDGQVGQHRFHLGGPVHAQVAR